MHFTVEAQRIASTYLSEGSIAIDATAGNGFDTLFLAEQVGASGVVYAVDIQASAMDTVKGKLAESQMLDRCKLSVASHADLKSLVAPEHVGQISVAMMNLGYLPFGDKSIVTTPESTLLALAQIHSMIRLGGLISIIAYRGHAGGNAETTHVAEWVERHLSAYVVEHFVDAGNPQSPILWILTRSFG
ncbi:MAG: class I SAM-dependent methyltransferase [Pirellula sp.]